MFFWTENNLKNFFTNGFVISKLSGGVYFYQIIADEFVEKDYVNQIVFCDIIDRSIRD